MKENIAEALELRSVLLPGPAFPSPFPRVDHYPDFDVYHPLACFYILATCRFIHKQCEVLACMFLCSINGFLLHISSCKLLASHDAWRFIRGDTVALSLKFAALECAFE